MELPDPGQILQGERAFGVLGAEQCVIVAAESVVILDYVVALQTSQSVSAHTPDLRNPGYIRLPNLEKILALLCENLDVVGRIVLKYGLVFWFVSRWCFHIVSISYERGGLSGLSRHYGVTEDPAEDPVLQKMFRPIASVVYTNQKQTYVSTPHLKIIRKI